MKIRGKLLAGFYLVTLLVLIAGFLGLVCTREVLRHFEDGEDGFRRIGALAAAVVSLAHSAETDLNLYMLLNDPLYMESHRKNLESVDGSISSLRGQVTSSYGKGLLDDIAAAATQVRTRADKAIRGHDASMAKTGTAVPRNYEMLIEESHESFSISGREVWPW